MEKTLIKKLFFLLSSISLVLLIQPIIQSFFFPIELEARESTLWLHILTIKEGINIYDPSIVAYANQAHGPVDPIFKYIIHKLFFFLEPWQVSRLNNVLFFLSIFIINYLKLKNKNNIIFIGFISISIYSLIFLFTKSFQGRADVTAMLLISWLCFFCCDQNVYKKLFKIIFIAFIFSIIIMTNWRFLPLCMAIVFFPVYHVDKFEDIYKLKRIFFSISFILLSFIPFLIILYLLFDFEIKKYFDYFIGFFYFENHFSVNHYLVGFKNLARIEKFYLLIILFTTYLIKNFYETNDYNFKFFLKILMSTLVFLVSLVSYLYNYIGGGIYYFTPVILFLWYLILFDYSKKEFKFNHNKYISILIIFFSVVLIGMALKNSIRTSKGLYANYYKALELHNYLSKITNNNSKVLSESLHFHKKKYTGEKIDIGDLISYRSTQVGGNYHKTYKSYLKELSNGKYDYIIHNFTGTHHINKLIDNQDYKVLKTFSNNYSNIGDVFILRKNFLSK
tara:strand:+ start:45 stop:1562 length:1518 start_codon:yes stop_codon:yes gene_type:complete